MDTIIKVLSLCITAYLVCESSPSTLSSAFIFIPRLIFNSAISTVVTLRECPCRLLTYTEGQRISYVLHMCVVLLKPLVPELNAQWDLQRTGI